MTWSAAAGVAPVSQAFPLIRRALKILSDREVSPQTGLLKSTLLQLDSTFSERNYGASSFHDFVEKLAQAGFAQLKHTGRSVMVELNEQFEEDAALTSRISQVFKAGGIEHRTLVFRPAFFTSSVFKEMLAGSVSDKTFNVAEFAPLLIVVQTTTKVVERCILMTTDPGDLVLDPTCGSGTTAFAAEEWGRR